jgi:hypothetical protein
MIFTVIVFLIGVWGRENKRMRRENKVLLLQLYYYQACSFHSEGSIFCLLKHRNSVDAGSRCQLVLLSVFG